MRFYEKIWGLQWSVNLFIVYQIVASCAKIDAGVITTSSEVNAWFEVSPYAVETNRVFGEGITYCAFTSMVIHEGKWYLAFREGLNHKNDDGVIRILCSNDGNNWIPFQVIAANNMDLRDPNLSVMPNGVLLLICGSRIKNLDGSYSIKTYYSTKDGDLFGSISPIHLPHEIDDKDISWLWRITWNGDTGYGAVYRRIRDKNGLTLVKTTDGVSYEVITELQVNGQVLTETKIQFLEDQTMIALIRSEGNGYLGISPPPYKVWSMKQLGVYLAGQDFIIDRSRMICATRRIDWEGEKTVVFFGDTNGSFNMCIELPSFGKSGGTSYPSLIGIDGTYYVSYYSMHETPNPCIYISRISPAG